MKLFVVSVKDTAVGAYMRPFLVPSIGAAARGFSDEVNRADSDMHKHPADYFLFELGTFEDGDAKFDLLPTPRQVARAVDVVKE